MILSVKKKVKINNIFGELSYKDYVFMMKEDN